MQTRNSRFTCANGYERHCNYRFCLSSLPSKPWALADGLPRKLWIRQTMTTSRCVSLPSKVIYFLTLRPSLRYISIPFLLVWILMHFKKRYFLGSNHSTRRKAKATSFLRSWTGVAQCFRSLLKVRPISRTSSDRAGVRTPIKDQRSSDLPQVGIGTSSFSFETTSSNWFPDNLVWGLVCAF